MRALARGDAAARARHAVDRGPRRRAPGRAQRDRRRLHVGRRRRRRRHRRATSTRRCSTRAATASRRADARRAPRRKTTTRGDDGRGHRRRRVRRARALGHQRRPPARHPLRRGRGAHRASPSSPSRRRSARWLERGAPPPEAPSRLDGGRRLAHRDPSRAPSSWRRSRSRRSRALVLGGPPPLAEAWSPCARRSSRRSPCSRRSSTPSAASAGQWVVLVADPNLERARERADALAERLAAMRDDVDVVDALTRHRPRRRDAARALRRARRARSAREGRRARARARRDRLRARALRRRARRRCATRRTRASTLDDVQKAPRRHPRVALPRRGPGRPPRRALRPAHRRRRAPPSASARPSASCDPDAMLTGYSRLDALAARRRSRHDCRAIGLVAGAPRGARARRLAPRARDVVLAALVVAARSPRCCILIRVLDIPLHAYDALVLPVLLGHHGRRGDVPPPPRARADGGADAIARHAAPRGPAASRRRRSRRRPASRRSGFCDFDGLRDLGWVGALGSTVGLVVALVVVPAGLRLWTTRAVNG